MRQRRRLRLREVRGGYWRSIEWGKRSDSRGYVTGRFTEGECVRLDLYEVS
jgi:hypothetical protein